MESNARKGTTETSSEIDEESSRRNNASQRNDVVSAVATRKKLPTSNNRSSSSSSNSSSRRNINITSKGNASGGGVIASTTPLTPLFSGKDDGAIAQKKRIHEEARALAMRCVSQGNKAIAATTAAAVARHPLKENGMGQEKASSLTQGGNVTLAHENTSSNMANIETTSPAATVLSGTETNSQQKSTAFESSTTSTNNNTDPPVPVSEKEEALEHQKLIHERARAFALNTPTSSAKPVKKKYQPLQPKQPKKRNSSHGRKLKPKTFEPPAHLKVFYENVKISNIDNVVAKNVVEDYEKQIAELSLKLEGAKNVLATKKAKFEEDVELLGKALLKEDNPWNKMFNILQEYKKETGSCLFPLRGNEKRRPLLDWCKKQRDYFGRWEGKEDKDKIYGFSLNVYRKRCLDSIGFVWDTREAIWNDNFEKLQKYHAENGDYVVPQKYKDDPQLGKWVDSQHIEYRRLQQGRPSKITRERIERLQNVGFEFKTSAPRKQAKPEEEVWQEGFENFKNYYTQPNRKPLGDMDDRKLIDFQAWQRKQYKMYCENDPDSLMTPERIQLLEGIGFLWKPPPTRSRKRNSMDEPKHASKRATSALNATGHKESFMDNNVESSEDVNVENIFYSRAQKEGNLPPIPILPVVSHQPKNTNKSDTPFHSQEI